MRISDWSSDVCSSDLRDVVALRRISIPHDVLGYDEQRQSAHAMFGRTRPGQHEMYDCLAEFVIPARNPHLRAEEPVAAVRLTFGAGADVAERRACQIGRAHV